MQSPLGIVAQEKTMDEDRKAFEEWIKTLDRHGEALRWDEKADEYIWFDVRLRYQGWQAALKHAEKKEKQA